MTSYTIWNSNNADEVVANILENKEYKGDLNLMIFSSRSDGRLLTMRDAAKLQRVMEMATNVIVMDGNVAVSQGDRLIFRVVKSRYGTVG